MSIKSVVVKDKTILTVDELKKIFPQRKGSITKELVDLVNAANCDDNFNGDEFLNTIVSYRDVMNRGAYSIKEYITAAKFCAYLVAENDNTIEAYKRARGGDEFVKKRVGDPAGSPGYNALSSAASRYRQSKLVKELLTATQMPISLMFQGAKFAAVAVLEKEMHSAPLSRDRINAADRLLFHVKPPENLQIELAVGPNSEARSMQEQLSEQLAHTVVMQKKLLDAGIDIEKVQKLGISEDIVDVDIDE